MVNLLEGYAISAVGGRYEGEKWCDVLPGLVAAIAAECRACGSQAVVVAL